MTVCLMLQLHVDCFMLLRVIISMESGTNTTMGFGERLVFSTKSTT